MNELMWDETTGSCHVFDFVAGQRNPAISAATFLPLWAGIASHAQAARLVDEWLPRFEQSSGIATTLEAKPTHQWAWPNGWAPFNWRIVDGLEKYGFIEEARRIMRRWCDNCAIVFERRSVMQEKYNLQQSDPTPRKTAVVAWTASAGAIAYSPTLRGVFVTLRNASASS